MHIYSAEAAELIDELTRMSRERLSMAAPLDGTRTPEELLAEVGQTVTPEGLGHEAARLWEEVLGPACFSADHPRSLAFIPNAPTKAAAAFDMLVGASSIYAGSWLESSGSVFAENQALRWVADLVGLPDSAGGVFVQGGTNGNLSALVAARWEALRKRDGQRPARWAVLLTGETHSSVKHMLEWVMDVDAVLIPGDERGRLTGPAVRAWIDQATPEQRDSVFAVVGTAGTTNLGVIDDLSGLADIAEEYGWWLHVDGAYGGAGLAAPSVRPLYRGIERADSFIVDPHKWFFSTFDCCALLYRDPAIGRSAHSQRAAYLDVITTEAEWNPSEYAVQLSRRARGLPFWFSLAVNGTNAYVAAIERTLEVARIGREMIDSAPHLRLLVEPDLSVLIFERVGWGPRDYEAWSDRLIQEQFACVTPTKHQGQVCTRFCIVNPLTTPEDLAAIIASMA